MKKRSTIRGKVIWIAFAINALCTVSYSVYSYNSHKEAFLAGIDSKLTSAAYALPLILPPGYHEGIEDEASVDPRRYHEIKKSLADYADQIGVVWIYSYLEFDGELKTTSTNAPHETLKHDFTREKCVDELNDEAPLEAGFPCSLFFAGCGKGQNTDACDPANYSFFRTEEFTPGIREAFRTMRPQFEDNSVSWGSFRSIFVPARTEDGRRYLLAADVRSDEIRLKLCEILLGCAGIGVAIFLVVGFGSFFLVNKLLRPVGRLTSYTRELAAEGFQLTDEQRNELAIMSAHYKDEVGQLAMGFSDMAAELLRYIEDLKATTAAKERIESELSIAHNIQMSFLPKTFPERREFELHAMLVPAKEVGGDLFDFYMVDDDRLLFYVGDVSDKGVPAALLMVVTMTLMQRASGRQGVDPAEVLRRVNLDLTRRNENMLFVTLLCGVVDLRTGELVYSNAGHNPPVILRADGSVEKLDLPPGLVLGVMEGVEYRTKRIRLDSGDSILAITDGVTEAMDPDGRIFTEQKLLEIAGGLTALHPEEQTRRVMDAVKQHAGEAPASDDITILSLKMS